jgi:hypothetical protein
MTEETSQGRDNEVEENEVLRAARAAKEQQERAHASSESRVGWKTAAAAGIGIGSAALIAALLYARRDRD